MKGISISIEVLIALAIALIVLLAAIAWFMGSFGKTASAQTVKQNFDSSCMTWTMSNCADCTIDCTGDVPTVVCDAYKEIFPSAACTNSDVRKEIALACGCVEPFGRGS